jgi:lipid II:glycine glycyltransferase (peptidoglycan interpeptide bridge formation enzyme)
MEIITGIGGAEWDERVARMPGAHVLQTWEWAQVKAPVGWQALPAVWPGADGAPRALALILERALRVKGISTGVKVLYVPKGPLLDWSDAQLRNQVLDDLQALARQRGAIFLKLDPDVLLGRGLPGTPDDRPEALGGQIRGELEGRGWRFSGEQIQFRNTVCIDLRPSEAEMLECMKQKTRYNVRLAEKKGVRVRQGGVEDIPTLYKMYAETAVRDGFVIRDAAYYHSVWALFFNAGLGEALIAEVEGEPVAAVILFHIGQRGWYLYGMSRQAHREKMPNYLLQWEAMRRLKSLGCTVYDLWGAPDTFDESDSMWGVFRFKEGLGGEVVRTLGAWDFPARRAVYPIYTQTLPRLLDLMRRRGRERTQQEVLSG